MTADLWKIHDSLSLELGERRQRAAVYLGVAVASLGAATAAGFNDALRELLRSEPRFAFLYFFGLAYGIVLVGLCYVGLSPGLPWERSGAFERVGWLVNRLLGAAVSGGSRVDLQSRYDAEGVGYRSFLPFGPITDQEVRRRVKWATDEQGLSWRIVGLAIQIHQYRLWRRLIVSASLVALPLNVVAPFAGVVVATRTAIDLVVGAILCAVALYLVLVALLRRTARTSEAW